MVSVSINEEGRESLKRNNHKITEFVIDVRTLREYEKAIAAMNMTLDGFCDHTAMIADDIIGTEVKKCQ